MVIYTLLNSYNCYKPRILVTLLSLTFVPGICVHVQIQLPLLRTYPSYILSILYIIHCSPCTGEKQKESRRLLPTRMNVVVCVVSILCCACISHHACVNLRPYFVNHLFVNMTAAIAGNVWTRSIILVALIAPTTPMTAM